MCVCLCVCVCVPLLIFCTPPVQCKVTSEHKSCESIMSFNQLRCSFVCKLTFFFLGSTVGKGKESGKSHRKREFGILRPHQKYASHILLNIYSCITYFIKYLSKSPKYICTFNMYIYLYIHLKSVICKTLKVWLLTIKLCNEN